MGERLKAASNLHIQTLHVAENSGTVNIQAGYAVQDNNDGRQHETNVYP